MANPTTSTSIPAPNEVTVLTGSINPSPPSLITTAVVVEKAEGGRVASDGEGREAAGMVSTFSLEGKGKDATSRSWVNRMKREDHSNSNEDNDSGARERENHFRKDRKEKGSRASDRTRTWLDSHHDYSKKSSLCGSGFVPPSILLERGKDTTTTSSSTSFSHVPITKVSAGKGKEEESTGEMPPHSSGGEESVGGRKHDGERREKVEGGERRNDWTRHPGTEADSQPAGECLRDHFPSPIFVGSSVYSNPKGLVVEKELKVGSTASSGVPSGNEVPTRRLSVSSSPSTTTLIPAATTTGSGGGGDIARTASPHDHPRYDTSIHSHHHYNHNSNSNSNNNNMNNASSGTGHSIRSFTSFHASSTSSSQNNEEEFCLTRQQSHASNNPQLCGSNTFRRCNSSLYASVFTSPTSPTLEHSPRGQHVKPQRTSSSNNSTSSSTSSSNHHHHHNSNPTSAPNNNNRPIGHRHDKNQVNILLSHYNHPQQQQQNHHHDHRSSSGSSITKAANSISCSSSTCNSSAVFSSSRNDSFHSVIGKGGIGGEGEPQSSRPIRRSRNGIHSSFVNGGGGGAVQVPLGSEEKSTVNIYVQRLSENTKEKELKELFSTFGPLASFVIIRDLHTSASLGKGFVRFEKPEDATRAFMTLNGHVMHGEAMMLQWAAKKHDSTPAGEEKRKIKKMFIRNIPLKVTRDDIVEMCQRFGPVVSVALHSDTIKDIGVAGVEQQQQHEEEGGGVCKGTGIGSKNGGGLLDRREDGQASNGATIGGNDDNGNNYDENGRIVLGDEVEAGEGAQERKRNEKSSFLGRANRAREEKNFSVSEVAVSSSSLRNEEGGGGGVRHGPLNIAFVVFANDGDAEKAVNDLHSTRQFPQFDQSIPLMVKLSEGKKQRLERRKQIGAAAGGGGATHSESREKALQSTSGGGYYHHQHPPGAAPSPLARSSANRTTSSRISHSHAQSWDHGISQVGSVCGSEVGMERTTLVKVLSSPSMDLTNSVSGTSSPSVFMSSPSVPVETAHSPFSSPLVEQGVGRGEGEGGYPAPYSIPPPLPTASSSTSSGEGNTLPHLSYHGDRVSSIGNNNHNSGHPISNPFVLTSHPSHLLTATMTQLHTEGYPSNSPASFLLWGGQPSNFLLSGNQINNPFSRGVDNAEGRAVRGEGGVKTFSSSSYFSSASGGSGGGTDPSLWRRGDGRLEDRGDKCGEEKEEEERRRKDGAACLSLLPTFSAFHEVHRHLTADLPGDTLHPLFSQIPVDVPSSISSSSAAAAPTRITSTRSNLHTGGGMGGRLEGEFLPFSLLTPQPPSSSFSSQYPSCLDTATPQSVSLASSAAGSPVNSSNGVHPSAIKFPNAAPDNTSSSFTAAVGAFPPPTVVSVTTMAAAAAGMMASSSNSNNNNTPNMVAGSNSFLPNRVGVGDYFPLAGGGISTGGGWRSGSGGGGSSTSSSTSSSSRSISSASHHTVSNGPHSNVAAAGGGAGEGTNHHLYHPHLQHVGAMTMTSMMPTLSLYPQSPQSASLYPFFTPPTHPSTGGGGGGGVPEWSPEVMLPTATAANPGGLPSVAVPVMQDRFGNLVLVRQGGGRGGGGGGQGYDEGVGGGGGGGGGTGSAGEGGGFTVVDAGLSPASYHLPYGSATLHDSSLGQPSTTTMAARLSPQEMFSPALRGSFASLHGSAAAVSAAQARGGVLGGGCIEPESNNNNNNTSGGGASFSSKMAAPAAATSISRSSSSSSSAASTARQSSSSPQDGTGSAKMRASIGAPEYIPQGPMGGVRIAPATMVSFSGEPGSGDAGGGGGTAGLLQAAATLSGAAATTTTIATTATAASYLPYTANASTHPSPPHSLFSGTDLTSFTGVLPNSGTTSGIQKFYSNYLFHNSNHNSAGYGGNVEGGDVGGGMMMFRAMTNHNHEGFPYSEGMMMTAATATAAAGEGRSGGGVGGTASLPPTMPSTSSFVDPYANSLPQIPMTMTSSPTVGFAGTTISASVHVCRNGEEPGHPDEEDYREKEEGGGKGESLFPSQSLDLARDIAFLPHPVGGSSDPIMNVDGDDGNNSHDAVAMWDFAADDES